MESNDDALSTQPGVAGLRQGIPEEFPKRERRYMEQAYLLERPEKTSESIADLMKNISLQKPKIKTRGGECFFKCEDDNIKLQGT